MNLEALENIKRVEAPPFLYTRILQKIVTLEKQVIPTKLAWVLSGFLTLVMLLNLFAILSQHGTSSDTESLAQSLQLFSNNTLY